jgi:hypothetical protein
VVGIDKSFFDSPEFVRRDDLERLGIHKTRQGY